MGIIVINSNIFIDDKIKTNNIYREYSLSLIRSCFGKVTLVHETIFHYLLKICSSQDERITCKTPIKYFKNYRFKKNEEKYSKNFDGGDLGEALLFGEKIYEIYLAAVKNILGKKFWSEQKIDFAKCGTNFIKDNNLSVDYKKNLQKLSDFTNKLYDASKYYIREYNEKIDYTPVDIGSLSLRMRKNNLAFKTREKKLGQLSLKFKRNIPDCVD